MVQNECGDWGFGEIVDLDAEKTVRSAAERRVARKQWEARSNSFSGLYFFVGGFIGRSEGHTVTVENGGLRG